MIISIYNPFGMFAKRSQFLGSKGYVPSFSVSNGKIIPHNMVDAHRALQNVDIFAMINLISSDIASCDFQNGGQYGSLLKHPSRLINGYSFWQSVIIQSLLTGNGYLLIHSEKGKAQWLEQIPTSQVNVQLADSLENITYEINLTDDRGTIVADNSEMIHIRLMPTGEVVGGQEFMGISPLDSLVYPVEISENANRLTLSTLINGINPSTIINVPDAKLDKESKDSIRNSFIEQNTGENAGKVIVMDQSAQLSTVQINADVAKFLNNLDWSADRIAEAFGVPSSYLNRAKADAQSNSQQIMSFYASSLNRYINPMISELAFKLNLPDLKLNVRDSTDVDGSQIIDMISKLNTGTNPVFNADEVKTLLAEKGVISNGIIGNQDS
ncbi:phage portal protein [Pediococcus acidilactici]|uniref:phage portal protein n=1 Tax=Pediococcus acidilactici TaxID=1254 RepID=UPI0026F88819|nr:phage portal protein [Pediococcus acidilactici]MDO7802345.1 phage portal protein [Pediococcus acidilactici]